MFFSCCFVSSCCMICFERHSHPTVSPSYAPFTAFAIATGGLLHRGAQQQQQQQQQQLQQRAAAEQQHALLQQQQQMAMQQQRMAGIAQLQQQQQQMLALQQQQQMQAAAGLRAVLPGQVMPSAVAGLGLDSRGTQIDFANLELRRVIGTGQFGLVRVVRHVKTDEVFALKVSLRWQSSTLKSKDCHNQTV
jgi:hypothetical protein